MTTEAAVPSSDVGALDAQNPWPGLEAFTEDDEHYFHGRGQEVDALHRLVQRERLTVLFGVSGLGKTSLLQAGLFPILRNEHMLPVRIRLNYSEGMPELCSQIKDAIAVEAASAAIEAPSLEGTLWESFHREHADFWSARNRVVTPLLVFDQFEEIFTRGRETAERAADTDRLLIELTDLIEGCVPAAVKARIDETPDQAQAFSFQRHNYKVLLSLREDFLADLESLRQRLPSIMRNRLRLRHMHGDRALAAVVRAGGHLIRADVAARVVRFVGAESVGGTTELATLHVEPALLSVFCRELNLTRTERHETEITAELLEGRQAEILASFYERGLAGIGAPMRSFIEDSLVTVGGRRNSEPCEEALNKPGVTASDISLLVNRRILRIEDRAGMSWLELTHDRLTGVVRASRESRRQREAQAAAEAAEREAREKTVHARHELLKKTRTLRLVRGVLALAIVALVAAVGGAFFGFKQQRHAEAAWSAERNASRAAQRALADSHFRRARDLVDSDFAADALPYLSSALRLDPNQLPVQAYTLSLLSRRNWPLPISVVRASAEFEAIRRSPDGKLVATGSRDGKVQLWDAETATARGAPLLHRDVVTSLGFSADGRRLVTTSEDRTAMIWSVETARAIGGPLAHAEAVSWAGLTADGTRALTVSADGAATLWDVETGKRLFELRSDHEVVTVARLSRDGALAVTGMVDGGVRIWDTKTGSPVVSLVGHNQRINDVGFSPDGRRVATTSADKTARIWDAATGRQVGATIRHQDAVWDADFSPDGRLVATASDDGTVGVWSAETGLRHADLMRHASAVYTIEFSPDGRRIVTTSGDYSARVWDVTNGQPVTERMRHGDWLEASFNADGTRVFTASWDRTLRLWDVRPSASIAEPLRHAAHVTSAQFSPQGRYVLTCAEDHKVQVWNAATFTPIGAPMPHLSSVTHAEFSPDESRVMTMTVDGSTVWSGKGWAQRQPLGPPQSMAFSADWSRALTAVSDRVLALFDVQAGRTIGQPLQRASRITAASVSADARRAVTITDAGEAQLWNAVDGRPVGAALTDRGGIAFALFSPDGRRLLTGSKENTARVWDAETGRAIGDALRHYDVVTAAEFNHDGSRVVTASRDTAFVWNVETGEIVGQPMRHQGEVRSVHMSRDGRMIVTASDDRTARVWDADTGQPESEPLRHENSVRDAEFSPSGGRIVTASDDGTARVWDLLIGTPAEAGMLASLAEAVGGSALGLRGVAGQVDDAISRSTSLRRETADATGPGVPSFIRWFLADRATRPRSPWPEGTVR
ncbi:MAG: WD40 repeat domain-containing protein [Vicinamibacterales bacterium]